MREKERLYSISQHQKLSKSKKTVSLMYICCIWGLYLNKERRKTHFPLVKFTLDTGCMYNPMASIMWSYQTCLPLAQHHKCFFFPPSFERLVWDLNHSFYLKSLCSLHRWYSLTLPDPRFPYLPYEKEAVIMKHTTMQTREKMLIIKDKIYTFTTISVINNSHPMTVSFDCHIKYTNLQPNKYFSINH